MGEQRHLQPYKATAPRAAEPPPSTVKARICTQIQAEAKKPQRKKPQNENIFHQNSSNPFSPIKVMSSEIYLQLDYFKKSYAEIILEHLDESGV